MIVFPPFSFLREGISVKNAAVIMGNKEPIQIEYHRKPILHGSESTVAVLYTYSADSIIANYCPAPRGGYQLNTSSDSHIVTLLNDFSSLLHHQMRGSVAVPCVHGS